MPEAAAAAEQSTQCAEAAPVQQSIPEPAVPEQVAIAALQGTIAGGPPATPKSGAAGRFGSSAPAFGQQDDADRNRTSSKADDAAEVTAKVAATAVAAVKQQTAGH